MNGKTTDSIIREKTTAAKMYTNALKIKQTPFGWPYSLLYWTKCNLFVGSHMAGERKQLGETVCAAVLGEIFGFDSLAWISHFLWGGGLGWGRRKRWSQTDTSISFGQTHSINKRTQIYLFFCPVATPKDAENSRLRHLVQREMSCLAKTLWTRGQCSHMQKLGL